MAAEQEQIGEQCTLIWLGGSSDLLDAAWSLAEIHHVRTPDALLRALCHELGRVVVLDLKLPGLNVADLVPKLRQRWPQLNLLALTDTAPGEPPGTALPEGLLAQLDGVLGHHVTITEFDVVLRHLINRTAQRLNENKPAPSFNGLRDRVQHLEELVEASAVLTKATIEGDILGNLRQVAHVAVHADDMAVLLANQDYSDIADTLNLGVPPSYLETCRNYLASLTPEERQRYLGDEVLLRERQPDMLLSAPRVREAAAADAWSYMRLPLLIDDQLCGFVALFSWTPGQFDGAHLQLGRLFAAQVAVAVRNMQLYLQLNKAQQRQRAVGHVARLIAEDVTLDAVLERIVAEAAGLVGGRLGVVLLVQPDQSLVVGAVYGYSPDQVGARLAPGLGQAGLIAETGQPHVITDYQSWDNATDEMRRRFPEHGILYGVPLVYRGRVLGVLQVITFDGSPHDTADNLDVLMTIAPQAATAIAKAQLHEAMRRDQQQLQAILDHTAAAVVVCSTAGHILLANPEAERVLELLGLDINRLTGHSLDDLLKEYMPVRNFALPSLDQMIEVNLGEIGEYVLHIAPITGVDGAVERYVAVAQEVSEIRRIDRMKTDLIHILSHDLRNPLGTARGSMDLLDEPDVPPEQRAQLKNLIITSLDRMEQLMKDVMDLEMAESLGQETALPYQLSTLVQKVIERHQPKAASQNLTLIYHEERVPPRSLNGHAFLISQAIENLVNNAIKYTPSGGQIDVTLTVEGEYAVIRVKDTGIGIPPEHLPLVFQKFYRVKDKRARHIQGTGLGLSLVKTIAEAHGGSVSAESRVDEGSEFTLMLPLYDITRQQVSTTHLVRLDLSEWVQWLQSRSAGGA